MSPMGHLNYHGYKLYFNHGNGLIKRYKQENLWPNLFGLIKESVDNDDPMIFIDVGAHIGLMSLFVKSINSKAIIYAFEPSPIQRGCLERSVKDNALDIEILPFAVSDSNGMIDMYISKYGDERYDSVFPHLDTEKINVKMTTLDSWCRDKALTKVDVLKIDVEGAELGVIRGAEEIIRHHKPVIFLETDKGSEAYNLIQLWGYDLAPINPDARNADFIARYKKS